MATECASRAAAGERLANRCESGFRLISHKPTRAVYAEECGQESIEPIMSTARVRPPRQARPAGPPMPSFESLDETHRQILQVLDELEGLVRMLARPGSEGPAAELAARACRFFNGAARGHHEAEETYVFPSLLAGATAQLLAQVRRLQQDHNWLEEDWLELEPHLQAVAQGYCSDHAAFLGAALPEFTALYHEHIALEELMIYPEARRRRALQGTAA